MVVVETGSSTIIIKVTIIIKLAVIEKNLGTNVTSKCFLKSFL